MGNPPELAGSGRDVPARSASEMDAAVEKAMTLLGISPDQLYRRGNYANIDPAVAIELAFDLKAKRFQPEWYPSDAEQWRLLDGARRSLLDHCKAETRAAAPGLSGAPSSLLTDKARSPGVYTVGTPVSSSKKSVYTPDCANSSLAS